MMPEKETNNDANGFLGLLFIALLVVKLLKPAAITDEQNLFTELIDGRTDTSWDYHTFHAFCGRKIQINLYVKDEDLNFSAVNLIMDQHPEIKQKLNEVLIDVVEAIRDGAKKKK